MRRSELRIVAPLASADNETRHPSGCGTDVRPRLAVVTSSSSESAARRPVLIGSPPSAGSTLLSVILDAHPEIACGPELTLFSHALLFTDFARFKRAVARRAHIPSPWRDSYEALAQGLAPYSGIALRNAPYYGGGPGALLAHLQESRDAAELIDAAIAPWLADRNKRIFAEKSPENIYGVRAFLDAFPAGRAVVVVRHPLDQILSLKRRSFSFGRALSIWLVETALCLQLAEHKRVCLLRYEDLVGDPAAALDALWDFLDVASVPGLAESYRRLSPRIADDATIAVASWTLRPGDGIRTSAVGKGALSLTTEEIAAVHHARINAPPPALRALAGVRLTEIAAQLGYALPTCPNLPSDDLAMFLAGEMLLGDGDGIPRPAWWFHERMVECTPAGERRAQAFRAVARPRNVHWLRTRIVLQALTRGTVVEAKRETKAALQFVRFCCAPATWRAWLRDGLWALVTIDFKAAYQAEFRKAYLAEFAARECRTEVAAGRRRWPWVY